MTPPDIKESFGVGPLRAPPYAMAADEFEFHYGENYWPALPIGFRSALTRYFDAKIECIPTCLGPGENPKYEPVLAGQYLVERFTSAVN